jgi:tetratricopeptide (TPR) repeat protein
VVPSAIVIDVTHAPPANRAILKLVMPLHSNAPHESTVPRLGRCRKPILMILAMMSLYVGACEAPVPPPVSTPPLEGALRAHYQLMLAGEPGAARIRLRQIIDAGHQDSRALFLMGLAHHWERSYIPAAEWFDRACQAAPPYPPAHHFLGWALYHTGDLTASRTAFEHHLRMQPNEGDSHFALGVIALESGRVNDADAHLLRAIELQRSLPDRRGGVAKALARRAEVVQARNGNLRDAATMLEEAVSLDPSLYEAYYNLARVLRRLGLEHEADAADAAGKSAQQAVDANRDRPR